MAMMILQEIIFIHYMPLVEGKDFNPSIDNKPFFDQPVKKQEA